MYTITGITGKVGGILAHKLLEAGQAVRAVVRDAAKGQAWADRGCEVAIAEMEDAEALAKAFAGSEAVFILPPSEFDPEPGYPEAQRVIDAVVAALKAARPVRVLCLSTIGADAREDNLLTQRTMMEVELSTLSIPVTFLRPAWFLDNALWDVASARDEGVIRSFLTPADKPVAMVATEDIGRTAAELIQQDWTGNRVVELEGPARTSPNDLARAFANALGHPVRVEIVPRDTWETLFQGQGMKNPLPRMRMLDGFNVGWIDFPGNGDLALKGIVSVDTAISNLVKSNR
ncbi:MAG TPA: NmrA family NAD(P)-binding protein [Terracidiphilus sp.]|jgi:NAD(P)H dehydrogenase (quinone)